MRKGTLSPHHGQIQGCSNLVRFDCPIGGVSLLHKVSTLRPGQRNGRPRGDSPVQ